MGVGDAGLSWYPVPPITGLQMAKGALAGLQVWPFRTDVAVVSFTEGGGD
jgi:hypothetical protein